MLAVAILITRRECQKHNCARLWVQVCVFRRQRVPGNVAVILHIVHQLGFLQTQGCTNTVSHFMNILIFKFCPLLLHR
jgi:hypothetical protein